MAEQQWSPGTNGFVVAPFSVLTTELNSLADTNTVLSSVGGASGVFDQSNTDAYVWGVLTFAAGGSFTPVAPGYLGGWFLSKSDNSNYEKNVSNTALPRAYDFVVGLHIAAYSSGDLASSGPRPVMVPAIPFKVLIHSRAGATLPASGNTLKLGLVAPAMV